MLAVDTRIYVSGNQGGLHKECARAAHRIEEIRVAAPAGLHDYSGSEHFVDGGFSLLHLVATLR